MDNGIKERASQLRNRIEDVKFLVRALLLAQEFREEQAFVGQHDEMRANIMLSYRYLEDAGMRLGKMIQAFDGGISIYDNQPEKKKDT